MLTVSREEYAKMIAKCSHSKAEEHEGCAIMTWYYHDIVVAKAFYYADKTTAMYQVAEQFTYQPAQ